MFLRNGRRAVPDVFAQVLRFLLVGAVATALNAAVYYGLYASGVGYAVAMPAGFVCG